MSAERERAGFFRRHAKKLLALALFFVALPLALHLVAAWASRMEPPAIALVEGEPELRGELRRLGFAYATKRGAITELRLGGSAEEIGHQHARLLYEEMKSSEAQLYRTFEGLVPLSPLRTLLVDLGKLSSRGIDRSMSEPRLREIASQARAFSPDPFAELMPTYQRLVVLNALYDVALGFEHSPLLGCTSFVARGDRKLGEGALLARNFDFEAGPVFDEAKVVFLVFEEGRIPFASVAWPGLVGVVSGMNAEGLAVVVHGARARENATVGEPVVHTARALLAEARDVDEAFAILQTKQARVSHLLLLADARGHAMAVERAPGEAPEARRIEGAFLPLTNHFEGTLAADPKNQRIREKSSTLPRRARLDELLGAQAEPVDAARAVELLRDRRGPAGVELPLGHRSTIDALIATHGVVMDTEARALWVSEAPHLLGRFVRFDLRKLLDRSYDPEASPAPLETIAADPALTDGRYEAWLGAGSPHPGAE